MDISIAMCTYNGERFLKAQLNSICEQTKTPFELIICDDGSSDSTASIVDHFAATVSFTVRYHRNSTNLGSTKNFEQAMKWCRGEAIALCDQDDIWNPDKLEVMAAALDNHPEAAGVFSNAHLIDGENRPLSGDLWARVGFTPTCQHSFNCRHAPTVLIRSDVVTGATFLFRAAWLPLLLPIPAEWVHDGWIALLLASMAALYALPAFPMSYRIHAAQQVGAPQVAWHQHFSTQAQIAVETHRKNAHRLQLITAKMEQLASEDEAVCSQVFLNSLYELRRKLKFVRRRARLLYESRFHRILPALFLLPGYTRYEKGLMSLLRDLTHRTQS